MRRKLRKRVDVRDYAGDGVIVLVRPLWKATDFLIFTAAEIVAARGRLAEHARGEPFVLRGGAYCSPELTLTIPASLVPEAELAFDEWFETWTTTTATPTPCSRDTFRR